MKTAKELLFAMNNSCYIDRPRIPLGYRALKPGERSKLSDLWWNGYNWVKISKRSVHCKEYCTTIRRKDKE